jgi:hypothetical protein
MTRWGTNMILLSRALPSRNPANARPSDGTQDASSADPSSQQTAQLALAKLIS